MIDNQHKKILVTGASGMLGLELCRVLNEKSFDIKKDQFDISSSFETQKTSKKFEKKEMWLNTAKTQVKGYKMPLWKTEVNSVLKEIL